MLSKGKNIIKKKKSYLVGLKSLSTWMFNSQRNIQELESIIQKYDFDITIFKRLISYTYNTPHITWYVNKYMNNLYDFSKFNLVDLIYSYLYLLDVNQKSQSKKLFYLKSDDLADKNKAKIKNLLNDFFSKIYDKNFNDQELNFYYDLFNLGIISIQDINEIDLHINSGKSTVEIDETQQILQQNTITNSTVLDIYRTLPKDIDVFCNKIRTKILNRKECQQCELFGKPTVILDTNVDSLEEVDIIFIGLNPGKDEVILNKPFVGKSGMLLREKMSKLPSNVKWLITNVILCHTRNEKEIKKPDLVINNCQELVLDIINSFPSKYYVPLGAKAAKTLNIDQNISSVSGKKFTSQYYTIIPLIHPSSAVNYGQLDKFNADFETIYELFKEKLKTVIKDIKPSTTTHTETKQYNAQTNNKFITEVTPDLTLFDIREVNNKIIKIFIDKDFNKKYMIEDYLFNFYIKTGDWKNCYQVVDDVDIQIIIPGDMKTIAAKKVRDKLNSIKEI